MATKPSSDKEVKDNGKVPESARTNGEKRDTGRTPTVGEPETRSFNERTAVRQPFILDDGTQDNGARDLSEIDGAKGRSTREGDQSTREDTKDAIDKGLVPASDEPDVDEEPVKNPVE